MQNDNSNFDDFKNEVNKIVENVNKEGKKEKKRIENITKNINNAILDDYFCIFLDILGYQNILEESYINGTRDELFKKILQILSFNIYDIKKLIKDSNKTLNFLKIYNKSNIKKKYWVKTFSDNILIVFPFRNSYQLEDIYFFITYLANIQYQFIINQLFIRGAWNIGNIYIDNDIIYGKGIIDVYNLEKKAFWPRIILSKEIITYIKGLIALCTFDKEDMIKDFNDLLLKDENYYYINFYKYCSFAGGMSENFLNINRQLIQDNLTKYKDNDSIYKKYDQFKNYFNSYCKTDIKNPQRFYIDENTGNLF